MQRTDSLEKTLMLGKIEGFRLQRMRWLDGIMTWSTWVWASSGSWWWTGKPGVLQSMGLQRVGHDWATELNWICICWVNWCIMAELSIRGPYIWKSAVAEKKVRVQNKKWTPPTHILPLVNIQRRIWKTANFPLLISLLFLYPNHSQEDKNQRAGICQPFNASLVSHLFPPHIWLRVCVCVCVRALSHVWLFVTPWIVACQAPWNFPGKNTGVKCHFLLQGIFLTQGLNPSFLCFLHWQADSLPLPYLGSPWTVSNNCFSTPEVTDRLR